MGDVVAGIRALSARFFGGWRSVDLTLAEEGEPTPPVVVVVGGNGTGKTGLLRAIARGVRRGQEITYRDWHCGNREASATTVHDDGARLLAMLDSAGGDVSSGFNLCSDLSRAHILSEIGRSLGDGWALREGCHGRRQGDGQRHIHDLVGSIADAGECGRGGAFDAPGVVVLDDVDAVLDPTAQTKLVPLLRGLFPRVQIILATRSPFTLAGCAPDCRIVRVSRSDDGLRAEVMREVDPRLLTLAQSCSLFLGGPEMFPTALGQKLQRYGRLAGVAERDDEEEAMVQRLYRELADAGVDVWEPVRREKA
jgi:hypothetical protein